jgi:mono/diheme cytochrome c family protein
MNIPSRRNRHIARPSGIAALAAVAFLSFGGPHDARAAGDASTSKGDADPATVYHRNCSVCHGDRGDGRSRAQGSMVPPPRDFTSAQSARDLDRDRMIRSVRDGRSGTAMAAWGGLLDDAQIEALVDHIRATFMQGIDDEGHRIYARNCSVCHGDDGRGAVWASTSLSTRPRDFTSPRSRQELGRERMIRSATHGRADTAMPGFEAQLSASQIASVVDFIRARFMGGPSTAPPTSLEDQGGHGHAGHEHAGHGHGSAYPDGLLGDASRGEALYRNNCVACHGERGDGQGPRAYFILPKPRNFTHPAARASLDRRHLFQAVSKGTLRTEMPAWEKVLDRQSIADVSEYVYRRFIAAAQPAHD